MTIAVGGDQVVLNSFNCPSLQPQPAVNPRATYRNVCGEPCKIFLQFNCPLDQPSNALPGSSANCGSTVSPPGLNRNDCTTIATAITILQASLGAYPSSQCIRNEILQSILGTTYNLDSTNGYYKQLNFGSCVAYIGVSAQQPTQACWSDLVSIFSLSLILN